MRCLYQETPVQQTRTHDSLPHGQLSIYGRRPSQLRRVSYFNQSCFGTDARVYATTHGPWVENLDIIIIIITCINVISCIEQNSSSGAGTHRTCRLMALVHTLAIFLLLVIGVLYILCSLSLVFASLVAYAFSYVYLELAFPTFRSLRQYKTLP